MIDWIPRLIVLLVALTIVALVVRSYADRDVDASSTQIAAYLARLERDEKFYLWKDPVSGRSTPGVIDAAKLTPETLNTQYGITGTIASKVVINASCIALYEAYHDKVLYDRFFSLAALERITGPGGATLERWALPVTIVNGNDRCAGMMHITVVRPNRPVKVGA
jgi:hypothetical protein